MWLDVCSHPSACQCGAAILLKGTREELLRFVFNVYNQHERNGRLRSEDLTTALFYLNAHRSLTMQHCQKVISQLFQVADARRQDYVRQRLVLTPLRDIAWKNRACSRS